VPEPDVLCGRPLLQLSLGQFWQAHVVEGGHDQVGARVSQRLLITESGHADRGHASGFGRLDTAGGVLDDEAVVRGQAEFRRCRKEDHRVGFAARKLQAGDVGVEQVLQSHPGVDEFVVQPLLSGERVEPDRFKKQPDVLGRGRRRHQEPAGLDRQDEPQRVREGHEPALLDEPDDVLLLDRRVTLSSPLHVRDPEVLERGPRSGQPRHPRHHLLVHRSREALGRPAGLAAEVAPLALHQLLEGHAPGQFVR
jgi:hypothetical protein